MPDSPPESRRWTRDRLLDVGIVLTIGTFAAFLSGARTWVGFNSPDSEFYASLALFGDDVADRAIEPAYQWTRLGYIAPVRLLVAVLDPWVGFALWRFILIVVIAGSIYAVVRLVGTRQLAVLVAGAASLGTVVLGFVGNTYLTGTILAAVSLLLALGVWACLGAPARPWLPPLIAGGVAGWLVMLNPYAAMLGMSMWVGIRIVQLVGEATRRWRALARDAIAGIAGFAIIVVLFLIAGTAIFPGRSWLGTYLEWNGRLDYASFIGDGDVWKRDIALLIPVAAILLCVIAVIATRASRAAVVGLVIASTNIAFTAVYLVAVPGPWLESPTYVAKLWPGALVGIALAYASISSKRDLGWAGWAVALVGLPCILWSGRWDSTLSVAQGLAVLAGIVGVFIAAAGLGRSGGNRWWGGILVASLGITTIGAQVLQNGRGQLGTYGQYPFRAAYVDFDAEALMRAKVTAEEWLLARTTRDDTIGIWTDPGRLTAAIAAMQMWGAYNNVSGEATLTRAELSELEKLRPTAIAMYAPTREQIDEFWSSLPPWSRPSDPECTTVPYLGIGSPVAHVCLTRLRWLG